MVGHYCARRFVSVAQRVRERARPAPKRKSCLKLSIKILIITAKCHGAPTAVPHRGNGVRRLSGECDERANRKIAASSKIRCLRRATQCLFAFPGVLRPATKAVDRSLRPCHMRASAFPWQEDGFLLNLLLNIRFCVTVHARSTEL